MMVVLTLQQQQMAIPDTRAGSNEILLSALPTNVTVTVFCHKTPQNLEEIMCFVRRYYFYFRVERA
jgi:hypothetical protein